MTSGQNFSWGGLATSTFIGAASAAVTFGIGTAAGNLFTNFYSQASFQAIAHGTFQGAMTGIQGGNFWNGFAAGALSSIASSAFRADLNGSKNPGTGWAGNFRASDAGMIAFGTVAGGAGAALTGGNFWQGAVTGLVVSGLNHYAHQMKEKQIQKQKASFESGVRKVLSSAKIGDEITSSELVADYGIPKKAASLINSFTKISANSFKVDWVSDWNPKMILVNKLSDAVFNDGIINVTEVKGGLQLSGNGIGISYNGTTYYNLSLKGDFARLPTVTNKFKWEIGQ